MVIVTVEDETDDKGEPIVTVLRMKQGAKKLPSTRRGRALRVR
jgi:hypothetical protein